MEHFAGGHRVVRDNRIEPNWITVSFQQPEQLLVETDLGQLACRRSVSSSSTSQTTRVGFVDAYEYGS